MIVQYSGIFTTQMCNGIAFGRSVARYDNIRNPYKHTIYANIRMYRTLVSSVRRRRRRIIIIIR